MAPLAGLLVEYLVVGAVAGLWLGPLVINSVLAQSKPPNELLALIATALVPALYLAGMICDLLGYKLLHNRKSDIEAAVRLKAKLPDFSAQEVHALAVACDPALARELDSRSTRDRIARGSLIASIPLLWLSPLERYGSVLATTVSVFILVTLYLLWHRMQTLSSKYEVQVVNVLATKYKLNVTKKPDSDA